MNLLKNCGHPIIPLSSLIFLGGGISAIAFTLFRSISIPLLLMINPKSLSEETLKTYFLGFILRLCSRDHWKILAKAWGCSACVFDFTRISSTYNVDHVVKYCHHGELVGGPGIL